MTMNDFAHLYAIATGPIDLDWPAAYAARHERAEADRMTDRATIAELTARIAELEARSASLDSTATALAKTLAKLDGDSVAVELKTWCHQAYTGEYSTSLKWIVYSARRKHHSSGKTLDEAEAAFRAELDAHNARAETAMRAEQERLAAPSLS